ncbi:MAG TPA: hypothetical protein VJ951_13805 [Bacteroidales bacterium]|nr:hypothetical protein [Bacteroidales bacterium]
MKVSTERFQGVREVVNNDGISTYEKIETEADYQLNRGILHSPAYVTNSEFLYKVVAQVGWSKNNGSNLTPPSLKVVYESELKNSGLLGPSFFDVSQNVLELSNSSMRKISFQSKHFGIDQ